MSNQYTRAIARGEKPSPPKTKDFLFASAYRQALDAWKEARGADPVEILKKEIMLAQAKFEEAEAELHQLTKRLP